MLRRKLGKILFAGLVCAIVSPFINGNGISEVRAKETASISSTEQETQKKEKIKGNIQKYTVALAGKEYTLPISMDQILADGWKVTEPMYYEDLRFGEDTMRDYTLMKNGQSIAVRGININPKTNHDYTKYLVYSITGKPDVFTVNGVSSKLTINDMIKIMGKPHMTKGDTSDPICDRYLSYTDDTIYKQYCYYDEYYTNSTYNYAAVSTLNFIYDPNGKLVETSVESMFIDLREILDQQTIEAYNYVAPSKVMNATTSYTFQLGDVCYKLPVPVRELVKQGWEFNNTVSYIGDNSWDYQEMNMNGKTISVQIRNEADSPRRIEDCLVTALYIDKNTTINYKLPSNLKVGMSKDKVKKLYKNEKRYTYTVVTTRNDKYFNYNGEKNYEYYEYYHIVPQVDGNQFHEYEDVAYNGLLSVDLLGDAVVSIEYTYDPDYTMGSLSYTAEENEVTLTSNKEAFAFFNYATERSRWVGEDGRCITFTQDGLLDSYYDGDEWFSGDVPVPCSFDYKNNAIDITYRESGITQTITYKIISSERVIFYIEGHAYEFCTKYVDLNLPNANPYNQTAYMGQKKKLSYEGVDNQVTYSNFISDNTKIVKVNKKGVITPVRTGVAYITCTITKHDIPYEVTVSVKVVKPYIKFKTVSTTMKKGKSQTIIAKAYGLTGAITYRVNNTKIATINSKTGKLVAKKKGKVVVTATCGGVTKKITITIK
ncbi:Ig-like domain-containing protein [Anaerosporobacter faecicola]|uniref:Ig-like domain-containing protein n=1 Tax=Anaerosporobacter faecicola TaxID=2718714 RepID=UPI001439B7A5|nr:Ig-like domain-containing protein [Anaerosporobacter faecicola]